MFKAYLLSGVSSFPIGSPGGTVLNNDDTEKINAGLNIKICTRNVRTLAQSGKVHDAVEEMGRLKMNILEISEMRWPGSNFCDISDYRVYYLGIVGGRYQHGVGVTVKK
ncbi:hypothetical protein Trydic_g14590 [Trypoxylus dichotomus]